MQRFLRDELEKMSQRPDKEEVIRRIRERLEASGTSISAKAILRARDRDRK
ncbi:MAG: hypothetical protein OXN89_26505 [Bryobacterales bacterium]|nr:hypothetical protein [Bryobacterales bacterium]